MKGFTYTKRFYGGPLAEPFTSRSIDSPIFSAYLNTGKWWSHSVSIGNMWVLRLTVALSYKERFVVGLDFLKLGQVEFNIWWPGA